MVLCAIFSVIAILGSSFSFPVLGARCSPIQHLVNVLSAVILGPGYALAQAFIASLLRNMFGLGTLLAFPGSIFGASLSGLLYRRGEKLWTAFLGEVFGTAVIGGLVSYPIAYFIMGNKDLALFSFVVPFLISTAVGSAIALVILLALKNRGLLNKMKKSL